MLMTSNGHVIQTMMPATGNIRDTLIAGRRVVGIAFDTQTQIIYWVDPSLKKILRAYIPSKAGSLAYPQELLSEEPYMESLAYDWIVK